MLVGGPLRAGTGLTGAGTGVPVSALADRTRRGRVPGCGAEQVPHHDLGVARAGELEEPVQLRGALDQGALRLGPGGEADVHAGGRYLEPTGSGRAATWSAPIEVDLDPFADSGLMLSLEVDAGPVANTIGDEVWWGEPLLTRSPGHYRDWIRACKGGEPSCSNFGVAAPFVEWMLLGVVALRVEGKLEYDAAKMAFTNNKEANKYLRPNFRKGWSFI